MPWPSWPIFLVLLAATVGPPGTLAQGNVGCLFSDRLCLDEEWCYDDYVFGRCLEATSDVDEDDLFRYNLEREILHQLSRELRRLFALGYRWSHGYTQCRLQAMLYAHKHGELFDDDSCSHLIDQDLEAVLKVMEGQEVMNPEEMAIIKFTPSLDNPHADFADEVYYPPLNYEQQREALREKILGTNGIDIIDKEDPYIEYISKRVWIPQMERRSLPSYESVDYGDFEESYQVDADKKDLTSEVPSDDSVNMDVIQEMYPLVQFLNRMNLSPEDVKNVLSPKQFKKLQALINRFEESELVRSAMFQSLRRQHMQDLQREQQQEEIALEEETAPDDNDNNNEEDEENFYRELLPPNVNSDQYFNEFLRPRIYMDEGDLSDDQHEYGSGEQKEIFRELKNSHKYGNDIDLPTKNSEVFRELKNRQELEKETFAKYNREKLNNRVEAHPGVYTEGGVLFAPHSTDQEHNLVVGARSNSQERSEIGSNNDQVNELNLGFKRPERFDVKKPGPLFSTQNTEASKSKHQNDKNNTFLPSMIKKEPRGAHPNPSSREGYDVDVNYVYIKFKNRVNEWNEGNQIVQSILPLIHLEPTEIANGRVDKNEVTFKVLPNSQGLNASEVAKKIDDVKDELKERTGIILTAAGVGDRTKMQSVISTPISNQNEFYIVIFMVCGVLGALIIATTLLILIRKHLKARQKLHGLARPDTEVSKDYQDLCRARMAAKGQPVSDTTHGRITSLSRESEQSPSSRSSTSSWSEEPALHNMDISTGHMVLSYMEDHLKNKDRLEQEWIALCAYVAEPCETSMALKKENVEKNRYPVILPYDHSRVVLNELSNATGSDYVNASSITDHDPRNPAYIATQGPLPHTAPDFWQLIWEQGAVVIVMLTRLTEAGTAMCHRYWPEEGSEVYHIYEVHLVSEHIWCDDYLVRSFYLKNIRTGETRTVTQFHFLSWPESGVPASTKALLEFRRKVNKSYRGRSCPIVVHCSDGAGRTGTYCLIDMVLSRMAKGAKEIDIAATLEHLRDQRPKMVATKQQFEFVLTAVAEEVHAILKALPPQPAPQPQEKDKKADQ